MIWDPVCFKENLFVDIFIHTWDCLITGRTDIIKTESPAYFNQIFFLMNTHELDYP